MDKDNWNDLNLTFETPFIHSMHGSCGDIALALEYKDDIFPKLSISEQSLSKKILSIKNTLIENGAFNETQLGKQRCDLAIIYWLSRMKIDDIVFARNKLGEVFLCKVTGYVSEDFFVSYGCFQRPVKILQKLSESMMNGDIWHRTQGRKTIERNAKPFIANLVKDHLNNYNLV